MLLEDNKEYEELINFVTKNESEILDETESNEIIVRCKFNLNKYDEAIPYIEFN